MKEELDYFLKIANKYNKVKDLEETFNEFPVEGQLYHQKPVSSFEQHKKSFYDNLRNDT